MNVLWITTLVCLSACVIQAQEIQEKEKRGRVLCGQHLREALALVCRGAYNTQFPKRDGGDDDLQEEGYDYEQLQLPSYPVAWPFLSRQAANSLLQTDDFPHRSRRYTHGVVDECCHKICDYYTLRSYCAEKA